MSGKANKARRKQERLRQRRQQGQDRLGASGTGDVCPLYRDPPDGELYSTWIEGSSIRQTFAWFEAVIKDQRAGLDVPDLALRIPYLAAIYGRMLPIGAALQLDRHLDTGSLPVRWAPGDPVIMVPAAQMAPLADSFSDAETRIAIHDLHARGYLVLADDGTVIPRTPAMPDQTGAES
jgi:hypothetical protein